MITNVRPGHDLPLDINLIPGQPYYMLFQPIQGLPDIVTSGKKLGCKPIAKIKIISRLQHIFTSSANSYSSEKKKRFLPPRKRVLPLKRG
jgi:hypothetical protein